MTEEDAENELKMSGIGNINKTLMQSEFMLK